jgi:hypothetical protein
VFLCCEYLGQSEGEKLARKVFGWDGSMEGVGGREDGGDDDEDDEGVNSCVDDRFDDWVDDRVDDRTAKSAPQI